MAKSTKNMDDLFDDDEFDKDDDPNDAIADSVPPKYTIQDNLWDIVEKNMPKNTKKLMDFIMRYRDKYIDILETPYPVDYPVWTPACEAILYECLGFSADDLYEYTQNVEGPNGYKDPYLSKGYALTAKTHQFAMWMIYRYFILHNKMREATIMKYYIGYFSYTMAFTNFFKKFKPNKDIMVYTINRVSYRIKLKSLGSVHKWIYYGVDEHATKYHKRIVRGADYDYLYTIDKIRGRFNGYFKVIYREYYKDTQSKNYMFTGGTFKEDGDTYDTPSSTGEVITLAEQYTAQFFTHPISENAIRYATDKKGKSEWIPEKDLRNTIFMIADNPENQDDVRAFYQALFYIFINTPNTNYNGKDIHSRKFIVEMQKAYKPGNSNDTNRIVVRDMIDKWLKIGSSTYRSTRRSATQSIFRRAIFDYFIFKTAMD